MIKKCLAMLLTTIFVCMLTGCEKRGPVQRMGEKVDNAKESVQDTVSPKGPVEKTGREVDKALDTNKNS